MNCSTPQIRTSASTRPARLWGIFHTSAVLLASTNRRSHRKGGLTFIGKSVAGHHVSFPRLPLVVLTAALATTLTACGGGGGEATVPVTKPVTAAPVAPANTAPVARAVALTEADTGVALSLDGSSSHDADGDALTYSWRLVQKPAASNAALRLPTTAKPSFVPDAGGTYVLALVVNDGRTDSAAAEVAVTASTPIGGVIATPTVLIKSMSPYRVVEDLTVPQGSSLTVQPGVTLKGLDKKLGVMGKLQVAGTTAEPVEISDLTIRRENGDRYDQILDCQVEISWTHVKGGSMYAPNPNLSTCPLQLTDSHLEGTGEISIIASQGAVNLIERNVFTKTAGVTFSLGSVAPFKTTLSIQNNRFAEWLGGFAIRSTGIWGTAEATVRSNSFLSQDRIAVTVETIAPGMGSLDVSGNFWGTLDSSVILSMTRSAGGVDKDLTVLPAIQSSDAGTP